MKCYRVRARPAIKNKECSLCGARSFSKRCSDCIKAIGNARYQLAREGAIAVKKAVNQGRLPRLGTRKNKVRCVDCGKPAQVYDHREYSKPLVVEPVCRGCNYRRGPAVEAIGFLERFREQLRMNRKEAA